MQVRMGDAWLKNKEYGDCNREIDYEDLGRWFRCASKVCIRSNPCVVQLLPVRVICVCTVHDVNSKTNCAKAWALG